MQSDDEWAAFVRENASRISHACGTCKWALTRKPWSILAFA
ncbi:hypothetical protein SAMCFNEI73_pC1509 (plasmid) [Sinorhizobium americanum]|uniref:Uncharacterized protein n=1 Tax=Sinorhizobium americanum TaxID=194963 RepID=A0A1L3LYX5_9HYPH|nr:hypothetical protein SAMCFNEI73_pC1509 [Sinorhizobium americanum]